MLPRTLSQANARLVEEEDAIKVLEQRVHKAPSFSVEMLKEKVFGTFQSDIEFQLVHLAMMPLYSETFDANAALASCLNNVYNAESHSKFMSAIKALNDQPIVSFVLQYADRRL